MNFDQILYLLRVTAENYIIPLYDKLKFFISETLIPAGIAIYQNRLPTIRQFTAEKGISDEFVVLSTITIILIIVMRFVLIFTSPTSKISCRWRKDSRQPIKGATRWLCLVCGEYVSTYDRRSPKHCERGRWRDYL